MAFAGDRRKRVRVPVHWPVRLFGGVGRPAVETATENLSSEGFFCISNQRFEAGERLECEIVLPAESLGTPKTSLKLQCCVIVRRVEHRRDGFGVGCQIEEYTFVAWPRQGVM